MQLPALNPNTIIAASIVVAAVYGLLAGKQRLRILILSVYVGVVLADQLGGVVAPSLDMLDQYQVAWILFGAPIVIFGFFGVVHAKNHAKGAAVANLIVGLLTGALITSCALHLLPTSSLEATNNDSFLAMMLSRYHPWLLGLLPLVALILGFFRTEKKSH